MLQGAAAISFHKLSQVLSHTHVTSHYLAHFVASHSLWYWKIRNWAFACEYVTYEYHILNYQIVVNKRILGQVFLLVEKIQAPDKV